MKTTRRDFLKTSSSAAAAASAAYYWSSSQARSEDKNSQLKLAAIGVGGSRGRYNRGGGVAMQASRHAQMAAVCDVDELHTGQFSAKFGGKLTDWGAHHIDIAQWALGMDKTGPVAVSGKGVFPAAVPEKFDFNAFFQGRETLPNGYNAPTSFSIDLKFKNGSVLQVNNSYESKEPGRDARFGNGILLVGSKGKIFVTRGKLAGKPVGDLTDADHKKLDEAIAKLYKGKPLNGHMQNFFDCTKDRSDPVSDVYTHHRTMTSCHLCNINLMLGRDLAWDPEKEEFPGDQQANALMSRPSRTAYVG